VGASVGFVVGASVGFSVGAAVDAVVGASVGFVVGLVGVQDAAATIARTRSKAISFFMNIFLLSCPS
ncbi:MAG: hypothetical protein J6Z23_04855, partial [Lachnospiraceae bacterium]|nr:hypothetical protein [Lachnospiraceae bacterium]